MHNDTKSDKPDGSSYMYYRDYSQEGADVGGTIKRNHKTKAALVSKMAAKLRGKAGRFRGKSGTKENNKARGGKMAR